MIIHDIHEPLFSKYGRVLHGNFDEILGLLKDAPLPEHGTIYVAGDPKLEKPEIVSFFQENVYGGMPVQIGYCNGHNQKLNCLEFHKGNEINMANEDFILLLGCTFEMEDGVFDTTKTVAFRVPAGVAVEVFASTLHYAPCGINGSAFRVLVVLPKGTNVESKRSELDPTLWATNKWLLAHPDSKEAHSGAYIGLKGVNVEI